MIALFLVENFYVFMNFCKMLNDGNFKTLFRFLLAYKSLTPEKYFEGVEAFNLLFINDK